MTQGHTQPPGERRVRGAQAVADATARGALALGVRQVVVQGSNVLGGILLARVLAPGEFGLYAIVVFFVALVRALGEFGLGASLVRQPRHPRAADQRAVFSAHLVAGGVIAAVLLSSGGMVARAYGEPASAAIFHLLALVALLHPLHFVPVALLERRLRFDRLASLEIAQALVFNGLAVGLALAGMGGVGIAIAAVARGATGALLATLMVRWSAGWQWSWPVLKKHLAFGVPFQGSSLVSVAKDAIIPVFIGVLFGAAEVGYLNWAMMVASYPVLALMAMQRLYLPAFARMSAHPERLQSFVEDTVRWTNILVAPAAVLTVVLIDPFTRTVFGPEWLLAVPFFYLFSVGNLFVPTATPLLGLLHARGRAALAFAFTAGWMALTWLVGAPLLLVVGPIGFPIAHALIQISNLLLFRVVRREVPLRLGAVVAPAWTSAAVAGALVLALHLLFGPVGLAGLILLVLCGMIGYMLMLLVLDPAPLRSGGRWLRTNLSRNPVAE